MRLAQFAAFGAAAFLIAPRPRDDRQIEISRRELAIVQSAEAGRHGASELAPEQAAAVTARVIEDEVLYREGVRLGLDQDDPLIRQRVVQKVLLLAEELGGAMRDPTRAELLAEYERSKARYHQPPAYHVMHVFAAEREQLPATLAGNALPDAGEPFPLPREATLTEGGLRRSYGDDFADWVVHHAPASGFGEPVHSIFGWHRVRVVEVVPGRIRPFDEVAREVAFDVVLHRREDAVRRYVEATAAKYAITVDGAEVEHFTPTMRLARREEASAED